MCTFWNHNLSLEKDALGIVCLRVFFDEIYDEKWSVIAEIRACKKWTVLDDSIWKSVYMFDGDFFLVNSGEMSQTFFIFFFLAYLFFWELKFSLLHVVVCYIFFLFSRGGGTKEGHRRFLWRNALGEMWNLWQYRQRRRNFFYIISLLCFDLDCAVFIIFSTQKNFQKNEKSPHFFY